MHEEKPDSKVILQSYGPGKFKANQVEYTGSILITDEEVLPWTISQSGVLQISDFSLLKEMTKEFEFFLLGTGEKHIWPDSAVEAYLKDMGLIIESMSTASACRTYQILSSEGRRFLTGLIAI